MAHPRAYGTFARVLGKYVRDEGILTLEEAIRKMTSLPAENLQIRERGRLEPDFFADVVIFDPEAVQDHATFDEPHQYSTGVVHVFVNGEQGAAQGRAHRRNPRAGGAGPRLDGLVSATRGTVMLYSQTTPSPPTRSRSELSPSLATVAIAVSDSVEICCCTSRPRSSVDQYDTRVRFERLTSHQQYGQRLRVLPTERDGCGPDIGDDRPRRQRCFRAPRSGSPSKARKTTVDRRLEK